MTDTTAQKWFAKRSAVAARTDEDAAMASQTEGPFESQGVAHVELAKMIEHEVRGWRRQNMDPARDERALARVTAGETDVTEGGVRWFLVEITGNPAPTAKYKAGDRLHFRPTPERAPFGTAIDEGDVIVTEVVDHGHATHTSPRFTYVVQELSGRGQTQGTDDRELSEIEPTAAPAKARKPRPLSGTMRLVLAAIAIGDEDTLCAVKAGTWAALVTRKLVTPAARWSGHRLTEAGQIEADKARATAAPVAVEPVEEMEIPAVTVAQRIDHFIKADQIATEIGRKINDDSRLDLADVWDFSPNVDRAKLLRELAAELSAYAVAMDAAAGFEALSRTPVECANCGEPISLRFAEATSSDWKHIDTNQRGCGYHFGAAALARRLHRRRPPLTTAGSARFA